MAFKNLSKIITGIEKKIEDDYLIERAKEKRLRKGKKRIVDAKKSLEARRKLTGFG